MNIDLESLQRLAFAALPVLLDAVVKGLVLLGVAGVLVLAMRKASAAARQMVWLLAMATLLVLPLASAALPSWGVLPGWAKFEMGSEPGASGTGVPPMRGEGVSPSLDADVSATQSPAEPFGAGDTAIAGGPRVPREFASGDDLPQAPIATMDPAPEPTPAPPAAATVAEHPAGRPWRAWVIPSISAVWLTGAIVCLLPLVLGRISLWRLAKSARCVKDGDWRKLARQASHAIGLRRTVTLLQSREEPMPMVWGVFRPKLLLPAEAENWPVERRWVVLLHELAHAKRRDCLSKLIAHVTCALYWFNPLCWVAFKLMQREAESACDDLVLNCGMGVCGTGVSPVEEEKEHERDAHDTFAIRPSDYAQHLLEIASGLKSGMLAAYSSIAMARKSKLEGRLLAILDPRRNRRALTRLGILVAAVLVAGLIIPLACMKATGKGSDAATEAASAGDETSSADAPAEGHVQALESGLFTVTLWDGQEIMEEFIEGPMRGKDLWRLRKDIAEAVGKALKDKLHVELTDQSLRAVAGDGTEYWAYVSEDRPTIAVVGESSGVVPAELLLPGSPDIEYKVTAESLRQVAINRHRTDEGILKESKQTTVFLHVWLGGDGLLSGFTRFPEGLGGNSLRTFEVCARQPERAPNDSGASSAPGAASPSGKTEMTPATQAGTAPRPEPIPASMWVYRLPLADDQVPMLSKLLAELPPTLRELDGVMRSFGEPTELAHHDGEVRPGVITRRDPLGLTLEVLNVDRTTRTAQVNVNVSFRKLEAFLRRVAPDEAGDPGELEVQHEGDTVLGRPIVMVSDRRPDGAAYVVWLRLGAAAASQPATQPGPTTQPAASGFSADQGRLCGRAHRIGRRADHQGLVLDLSLSTAAMEGQVLDRAGRPVPDANVTLYWKEKGGYMPMASRGYPPATTTARQWPVRPLCPPSRPQA